MIEKDHLGDWSPEKDCCLCRCCLLPTKPTRWAAMESPLSISQRRFVRSTTLLSPFETKVGLETVKR